MSHRRLPIMGGLWLGISDCEPGHAPRVTPTARAPTRRCPEFPDGASPSPPQDGVGAASRGVGECRPAAPATPANGREPRHRPGIPVLVFRAVVGGFSGALKPSVVGRWGAEPGSNAKTSCLECRTSHDGSQFLLGDQTATVKHLARSGAISRGPRCRKCNRRFSGTTSRGRSALIELTGDAWLPHFGAVLTWLRST